MRIALATRSAHKAREIGEILGDSRGAELLSLDQLGLPETADEDGIEVYETFADNAIAKARFFAARTGLATVADDSGLVVDAIGGAPGVRSKRFAPAPGLSGQERDEANNVFLLERLRGVPAPDRTARYTCAAALVASDGSPPLVALGTCEGVIALSPQGEHGFGYDPLFYLPDLDRTFAQVPADVKNRRSHRSRAFRALATLLGSASSA